ncbi:hypothetical protein ACWDA3_44075 [Nonomuraea rubra]
MHADQATLRSRAERLAARLRDQGIDAEAVDSRSVVGGGGAPGVSLPSAAVALDGRMAAALRRARPSVLARVENGRCLLDLRAVPADQDDTLLASVQAVPSAE